MYRLDKVVRALMLQGKNFAIKLLHPYKVCVEEFAIESLNTRTKLRNYQGAFH